MFKNKRGQYVEWILGIAGAIFIVGGGIILYWGFGKSSPSTIGSGAVAFIIGVAMLIIAKKFG